MAERIAAKVHVLPERLSDVDEPPDLQHVAEVLGLTLQDLVNPQISVIIPTYNEAAVIENTLEV